MFYNLKGVLFYVYVFDLAESQNLHSYPHFYPCCCRVKEWKEGLGGEKGGERWAHHRQGYGWQPGRPP